MTENLIKKFIQFAMGNGIVLILGFISSPLITRLISPEHMGKYSMFNTICNLIFLFTILGLDQAYVRYFYEEEEQNRKTLLCKSIMIPLKINIAVSILLLLLYKPISKFIVGEYNINIILIMILFIYFSIIGRFSLLVVRMKQKAKLYSILQVLGKISYIAFALICFYIFKNNYITLILAITLSNVIVALVSIYTEKNDWNFKVKSNCIKTKQEDLLRYGKPLVFSMAITWIFQSIDKLTINIFSGYNELGLYSAAFSIVALLNAFQNTFTTFWVPVANEKYVNNSNDKEFFVNINKLVSLVMINLGILLITFKDIIVLLLGNKYREAVCIFPFLVFTPIMYTISETTVMGIGFKNKNKYHIYIAIISALINLLGNIILVPNLGAKGAAISTGISYVVFFTMRTYFSNKVYKVNYNLSAFYISTVMLSILAMYSTMNSLDINNIIISILSICTTLYLYRDIIMDVIYSLKDKFKKVC